jgi:hypothetical protein
MAKTLADIKRIRALASDLDGLGVPPKVTDKIRRWANEEQKRIRDKARK